MPLLARWASLLRNLLRTPEVERELDDELRAYVDLLAEEKMRAGMPMDAARRAARVEAGVEQVKEEVRATRAGAWIESVGQDVHYAWRGLRRSPAFAVTSVGSVGLAIAAATIVFIWAERMVLRPLPAVPESERVVRIWYGGPAGEVWKASYPDVVEWRNGTRSFDGVAAQAMVELGLGIDGRLVSVWGAAASWDLFEVLRLRPAVGRTFRREDEAAAPVALISHLLWRRFFAEDSSVIGRTVEVNGRPMTVIGVAPVRFAGADPGLNVDVWIPAAQYDLVSCSPGALMSRGTRVFTVIARLRPGVAIGEAWRDVNASRRPPSERDPAKDGQTAVVAPVQGWRAWSWLSGVGTALIAVTLIAVLVACANVANLLLERAASRRREIGIRLALGAGRWRLVRQWLVEGSMLALGGGGVGLLLAVLGKGLMLPSPASELPIGFELFLDARILAFTAGLTAAAALLIGLVPAVRASGVAPLPALRGEATTGAAGRGHLESAMVVSQVALSVVCLVFAALFLRGARRAVTADTGMRDPRQVVVFDQRLYAAGYDCSAGPPFAERMLERVRAVPGVRLASVATYVPLGVSAPMSAPVRPAEGDSGAVVEGRPASFSAVGADYFETVGTPIVRGRGFTRGDGAGSGRVAVVNETLAARLWPGEDPLGRGFWMSGGRHEVVGVARDARYTSIDGPAQPFVYLPITQHYHPNLALMVRIDGDTREASERIRRALAELDPRLPLEEGRTLQEHASAASWGQRLGAWTLGAVAALALLLCAVGLYGMLIYTVARRAREIAVRIAVGAGAKEVLGLVVGRALRLTWIGLAIGLALSFAAEDLLRAWVLSSGSPSAAIVGAVVLTLAAVALVAAWLPARRATRVDPGVALEAE